MAFIGVAAAIAAGSALYGVGKGIAQGSQANKIDKNNPRPTYQIPQEYLDNVNMARQMAQVGLPQQQYNNQLNQIGTNQAGGIQALGRSANPGSGIASLVRASNDAGNTLNAQDAAARQANQRFYIGENGVLGQQKLAQQQYNKFDKYTEQFNKSAALRGAANQNIQNGINGASSAALGLASVSNGGSLGGMPEKTDQYGGYGAPQPRGDIPMLGVGAYQPFQGVNWGVTSPYQNQYDPSSFQPFIRR